MFKKIVCIVSFILIGFYGAAQKDINNYKYIIVPKKFDFLKTEDQYQLNSLTKFLFNKYGYEAYFLDDKLPDDLNNERCLALMSDVSEKKGGMFKTKLVIVLKDCFGKVVMTSQIGESRLKAYDKSFNEALRDAFMTYQNTDYNYVPAQNAITDQPESVAVSNKELEVVAEKNIEKKTIVAPALIVGVTGNNEETDEEIVNYDSETIYYAQAIDNGFQVVNSEPKIIMVLLNTSAKDVFIVKDKNAIVFKEDGFWYYSENEGKLGEKQALNIKF